MKKTLKIISGAQTGVDRAALDAALAIGLAYGGSVPKGRRAEDGTVPAKYDRLTELKAVSYKVRTEQNVIDSNATLIFSEGKPSGGTALTAEFAEKHKKPCHVVVFQRMNSGVIVENVVDWLNEIKPAVLNVAGSRESKNPGIYLKTYDILRMILSTYVKLE